MATDIKSPPTKRVRRRKNDEKASTSASSAMTMEQGIWKRFPEDLFEPVIARLPIATIFRFRLVSRQWNSLLFSESFAKHCAEVPQTNPWFYAVSLHNFNSATMYDPSLKEWHHVSPSLSANTIMPMSSAGGLICFMDIVNKNFSVFNPLTRSLRELPPRSARIYSRLAVGMTLNRNSVGGNGYKVLCLGFNGEYEVYDSDTKIWVCPGNIPPNIILPLSLDFRSQCVSIDSRLYFMRARPDGILSYDTKCGIWEQYLIPLPAHLKNCTLAESNGQIMLVGLEIKETTTSVCVWELQKMTLLWKEVDRMACSWCLAAHAKSTMLTCLGNQGMLLLSLVSRRKHRLVTYDLSNREWQEAPCCMLPRKKKVQWFACGTAFYPSVTALA